MSLSVAVTRPEPQAGETARRLAALGYSPVLAPVLTVELVGDGGTVAPGVSLAFTSRTAPRLLKDRHDLFDLPVFAVGRATAEEARAAGFRNVRDAAGDVAALFDTILAARPERLVHLSGEDQRGDLAERLAAAGIDAARRTLYRTVPTDALPPEAADRALLYSPKSAAVFARLARGTAWASVPCAAISAAAADALRETHKVAIAERPDEPSLFAALARL